MRLQYYAVVLDGLRSIKRLLNMGVTHFRWKHIKKECRRNEGYTRYFSLLVCKSSTTEILMFGPLYKVGLWAEEREQHPPLPREEDPAGDHQSQPGHVCKYKCYRYITLYQKSDLCIPRNLTELPHSRFVHSCICERFISSQAWSWSVYLAATKYADRSWEYINRSEIHECWNLETEHYHFGLRK